MALQLFLENIYVYSDIIVKLLSVPIEQRIISVRVEFFAASCCDVKIIYSEILRCLWLCDSF